MRNSLSLFLSLSLRRSKASSRFSGLPIVRPRVARRVQKGPANICTAACLACCSPAKMFARVRAKEQFGIKPELEERSPWVAGGYDGPRRMFAGAGRMGPSLLVPRWERRTKYRGMRWGTRTGCGVRERERSRARLVPADDPQVESRWVQCPVGQRTRELRQAGEQPPDLSTTRIHVHVYTAAHTFPRDRTRPRALPLRMPRANIQGVP